MKTSEYTDPVHRDLLVIYCGFKEKRKKNDDEDDDEMKIVMMTTI